MSDSLFRKRALEEISSPEELDTLMQVTSPAGWLWLTAMIIITVCCVIWGVFGSINEKVQGEGVLIREDVPVVANVTGQILDLLVIEGDNVKEQQIVAKISQSDLKNDIRMKEDEKANTTRRYSEEITALKKNIELQKVANEKRRRTLDSAIRELDKQIDSLEKKRTKQERLFKKGLITETKILNTRKELASARNDKSKSMDSLAQIESDELREERKLIEKENERDKELDRLDTELAKMKRKLKSVAELRTPHDGKVVEIRVGIGYRVEPQTIVMVLEKTEKKMQLLTFIPIEQGKKVKEGMNVGVSPYSVKAEEYGYIVGSVKAITRGVASPQKMEKRLQNPNLVKRLTGKGTPMEMMIGLKSAETFSGFKWTSSQGPEVTIGTGEICSASIIVGEKTPIQYVIPALKKSLGLVQ